MPAARGSVLFNGQPLPTNLKERTREQFRRIQIVFQNADTVLNPAHSIARILARPLAFYHGVRGAEAAKRIARLLDLVKLPATLATRKPAELSGGQKQRVNLARALAAEPDLILCDEVTSALDTVVGAAVLDLLAELRRELGVSLMFISHDISTVRAVCDDVVVLYSGCKVDSGSRKDIAAPPFHPYADLLISSVPELRTGWLDGLPARLAVEAPAPGAGKPRRDCARSSTAAPCASRGCATRLRRRAGFWRAEKKSSATTRARSSKRCRLRRSQARVRGVAMRPRGYERLPCDWRNTMRLWNCSIPTSSPSRRSISS